MSPSALALTLALHAVIVAALLWLATNQPREPMPETAIEVTVEPPKPPDPRNLPSRRSRPTRPSRRPSLLLPAADPAWPASPAEPHRREADAGSAGQRAAQHAASTGPGGWTRSDAADLRAAGAAARTNRRAAQTGDAIAADACCRAAQAGDTNSRAAQAGSPIADAYRRAIAAGGGFGYPTTQACSTGH